MDVNLAKNCKAILAHLWSGGAAANLQTPRTYKDNGKPPQIPPCARIAKQFSAAAAAN